MERAGHATALLSLAQQLSSVTPRWMLIAMASVVALTLAYLLAEIVSRGAGLLIRCLAGDRTTPLGAGPLIRPVRLVRLVTFLLLALALIFPALELAGVRTELGLNGRTLIRWLLDSGLRIGLITLMAYLVIRVAGLVITRFEQDLAAAGSPGALERARRVHTIGAILKSTVAVLVVLIAGLMILRELGLDVSPILAGVGIVGLAVGFGAQTLVKDIISGFFLIVENQVRVGDVASINGISGSVENITLRTIVLRDIAGTVYVFPNGSITTLANMTKDYSYYVIDLGISYHEDADRVVEVLKEVGEDLRRDPIYGPSILDSLEVLGVDAFGDSQISLKLRIKTLPLKQWEVGRELRRRIKKRFDAEDIEIPLRQVQLRVSEGQLAQEKVRPTPLPAKGTTEPTAN
jgi:moderate conductance mechanosensitive channel